MDFSKLASLSIGLAAFLGGMWILLQIIKNLRRSNNNHVKQPPTMLATQPPRIATAGEQSADYWQAHFKVLETKIDTLIATVERMERKQ